MGTDKGKVDIILQNVLISDRGRNILEGLTKK
jgi:hypothetical protein